MKYLRLVHLLLLACECDTGISRWIFFGSISQVNIIDPHQHVIRITQTRSRPLMPSNDISSTSVPPTVRCRSVRQSLGSLSNQRHAANIYPLFFLNKWIIETTTLLINPQLLLGSPTLERCPHRINNRPNGATSAISSQIVSPDHKHPSYRSTRSW